MTSLQSLEGLMSPPTPPAPGDYAPQHHVPWHCGGGEEQEDSLLPLMS